MKFREITPIRLYESVIEQIMNLIKNDKLKPGDKLPPERELAEKFSISRGSLREAFRVLESKGLIKSKPGGGRFIREIKKDAFIDTENTAEEVKVIEEAFSRVSEEGRTEDEKKIESDTEFHLAIARASHNFSKFPEGERSDGANTRQYYRPSKNMIVKKLAKLC
jgi:GntR family transcriptional repressor for pyruvate dehydrogenase complex